MQESKQEAKELLKKTFSKVKETENGFKVNQKELTQGDLTALTLLPYNYRYMVKRSGAGIVVIIEC